MCDQDDCEDCLYSYVCAHTDDDLVQGISLHDDDISYDPKFDDEEYLREQGLLIPEEDD